MMVCDCMPSSVHLPDARDAAVRSHALLRRVSGGGLAPTAWQGHSIASVACASLSLHRSLLRPGQAVRREPDRVPTPLGVTMAMGPGRRASWTLVVRAHGDVRRSGSANPAVYRSAQGRSRDGGCPLREWDVSKPAVAAALCASLGGDEADFFQAFPPNGHVYRLVRNAAEDRARGGGTSERPLPSLARRRAHARGEDGTPTMIIGPGLVAGQAGPSR